MQVRVVRGDVLSEYVDVLICPANPSLRLSGGDSDAILRRGGWSVQEELDRYLTRMGLASVEPGTVVRTGPGPLQVRTILHAVDMTATGETRLDLVQTVLRRALRQAGLLEMLTVAIPPLGTSMKEFAGALRAAALDLHPAVDEVRVVVKRADDAALVQGMLAA